MSLQLREINKLDAYKNSKVAENQTQNLLNLKFGTIYCIKNSVFLIYS